MQQGCQWYTCCLADADDTITFNEEKSGLTDQGQLNGDHNDTLGELRQTWPHRGGKCVAICICGNTDPFQMARGRGARHKCGAA